MKRHLFAQTKTHKLSNGEVMKYVEFPYLKNSDIDDYLENSSHLKELAPLKLINQKGFIIDCDIIENSFDAAVLLLLKMANVKDIGLLIPQEDTSLHLRNSLISPDLKKELFGSEQLEDEITEELEEALECYSDEIRAEVHDFLVHNDDSGMIRIPIVDYFQMLAHHPSPRYNPIFPIGQYGHLPQHNPVNMKPYWAQDDYPIIVTKTKDSWRQLCSLDLQDEDRVIGFINEKIDTLAYQGIDTESPTRSIEVTAFDLNYELIRIPEPSTSCYALCLGHLLTKYDYTLDASINLEHCVEALKVFKGSDFKGYKDILRLVNRVISSLPDENATINQGTIENIIGKFTSFNLIQNNHPANQLNQLVAMHSVKSQVDRLVKSVVFEANRSKTLGLKSDTHLSVVFIGNPGTAKTTVARHLGSILQASGCILHNTFKEVTRKDLVGQYVGWTAMKVAKVFEEIKGGILFIDEAYSLLNETGRDLFADEAINEIITQIENNPDTLVIFAGYPKEMEHFIANANPGLRSRLTHIVHFEDYSSDELALIFKKLVTDESYTLFDEDACLAHVKSFVEQINDCALDKNTGNGRLMRKLFKRSISFMANRDPKELSQLLPADVAHACDEIFIAESQSHHIKRRDQERRIGFN